MKNKIGYTASTQNRTSYYIPSGTCQFGDCGQRYCVHSLDMYKTSVLCSLCWLKFPECHTEKHKSTVHMDGEVEQRHPECASLREERTEHAGGNHLEQCSTGQPLGILL